jgi:hypothetical protein
MPPDHPLAAKMWMFSEIARQAQVQWEGLNDEAVFIG